MTDAIPGSEVVQVQQSTITLANIRLIKLGDDELYNIEYLEELKDFIDNPPRPTEEQKNLTVDVIKMVQSVNDHTRISIGFKNIPLEDRDKYLKLVDSQTELLVEYGGIPAQTLFRGVVAKIDAKLVGSLYYLEIKGISWTYTLDVKKKSRSFSKPNLTYQELFTQISAQYSKAVISDNATNGVQLGQLKLQWQETAWQLLRRIAAGFGTGLVVNMNSEKPNFMVGMPVYREPVKIIIDQYNTISSIVKDTRDYLYIYDDNTQLKYKLTTGKFLNIGSPVQIINDPKQADQPKPRLLYVLRSSGTMEKGGDLIWEHILTPQEGLSRRWYPNRKIIGQSLEGVVLDRIHDKALVRLEIDTLYGGAAAKQYDPIRPYSEAKYLEEFHYFCCATPYTAEGNTGWYCMPEIGDTVKVYFPTEHIGEAFITQSIRMQGGNTEEQPYLKVKQPSVKIFRTKFGKEIRFDPNELSITIQKYVPGQKGQPGKVESAELIVLKLNDNDGVTLTTQLPVNIEAENDLTIASKKGNVTIKADGESSELNMICHDSRITMKGGITTVKGKRVKTN